LFIDHPGMGWHNLSEPGIDRSGTNAAIHALLSTAVRSLACIENLTGNTEAGAQAGTLAEVIAHTSAHRFYDPTRGAFADGLINHVLSERSSQQTNTLMLYADVLRHRHDISQSELLDKIVFRGDPQSAQNGPYLWYFLLEVLSRCARFDEALHIVREKWGAMVRAGATTAWETFAGDELDSLCHPWSAAPALWLMKHADRIHPGSKGD
jgi:hypothetical protein